MIVTLTLNPSLDRTIEVERLLRGEVIRARSARLDPGGKGVNVSRALLANDVPSRAIVPVGGPDGDQLSLLLDIDDIQVQTVRVAGRTRSNVTIAEPDGVITKLNEPGDPLTAHELDLIAEAVFEACGQATWLVACGSLPPGVPDDYYAGLCRAARSGGVSMAVDTSGPPLLAAVEAGPELVKPNREELSQAVGRPLDTIGDVVAAAQELRSRGARTVLVSLGVDGAVLVDESGVVTGEAPVEVPRSSVGAGDALLAGFLAAGAKGAPALAEGLTWAAAAVALPASRMPGPYDLRPDLVTLHPRPALDRSLAALLPAPTT